MNKMKQLLLLGLLAQGCVAQTFASDAVVFADFESKDWNGWTQEGNAFGAEPSTVSNFPAYMGPLGQMGLKAVNSYAGAGRPAKYADGDARTGKLTSPHFTVSHNYIHFLVGGGNHPKHTRVRLLDAVDRTELRTATGHNSNAMRVHRWDVSDLAGCAVKIEIEDNHTGSWGQIGCDHIVFSDSASFRGRFSTERWKGIYKYDVSDLVSSDAFYGVPESKGTSGPRFLDIGAYAGARIRGYITAPETGVYHFWVSARDGAELWLSEDGTKYRKQRIAYMGAEAGTGHGVSVSDDNLWDWYSSQMSVGVHLVEGQRYFIELLTQQGHIGGHHASIAWARPGGGREVLPRDFISTYVQEVEDAEDDYLPDAWESQYGLNTVDNGAVDRDREGERGDFDFDGLSNREEYILGTDPSNPDTDGDGLSDADEHRSYGTDPKQSDAPSEQLVGTVDLSSYINTGLVWNMTSEGLIPESFRGGIRWRFDVPASGYWSLNVVTRLLGDLYHHETVDFEVTVDGVSLGKRSLVYGLDRDAVLRVITPLLAAGSHTLELKIDNMLARRMVSIRGIKILEPQGADLDSDGHSDWVVSLLYGANSLAPYQSFSRTSPAFLEGTASSRSGVTLNGQPVAVGTDDDHWYAGLPLEASGTTSFTFAFGCGLSESGNIRWQVTNVLGGETLVVRKGDSLKLVAQPLAGATGDVVTLTVTPDFEVFEDFEGAGWNGWTVTGNAFGPGPAAVGKLPSYMGAINHVGSKVVNSYAGAGTPANYAEGDRRTGTLTSPKFVVNHTHIHFLVGGGHHPAHCRVRLIDAADNSELRTATGHGSNLMRWHSWDVSGLAGRGVRIQIEDRHTGGWGQIGCDQITFSNGAVVPDFASSAPVVYQLTGDSEHQVHLFDRGGVYSVEAVHGSGVTATTEVRVRQADFSATPQDLISNSLANVKVPATAVDSDLYFDGGDAVKIKNGITPGDDWFYLRAAPVKRGSYNMLARLHPGGPVLGAMPLNLIGISDALQNDQTTVAIEDAFPGYWHVSTPVVATGLPPGGTVVVRIYRAGVTFLDGTTVKTFSVDDIVNDTLVLNFLFPAGMSGGYCHHLDIYDRHGNYLGRR